MIRTVFAAVVTICPAAMAQPSPSVLAGWLPPADAARQTSSQSMKRLVDFFEKHITLHFLSDLEPDDDLDALFDSGRRLEFFHLMPPKTSSDMYRYIIVRDAGTADFWVVRAGGFGGEFSVYRGNRLMATGQ
ncbi:MAG: hypothetical protein ACK4PH_11665 [Aquincola tertiaricarbonis]